MNERKARVSLVEGNLCIDGNAPPNTNQIFINFSKDKTVGELAATICHEICHRVLEIKFEEKLKGKECRQRNYIYPVHLRYINDIAEKPIILQNQKFQILVNSF